MEARGITQAALSRASGISSGNISKYLSGVMQPGNDTLALLAATLNVEPLWRIGEKESDNSAASLSLLYDKLDNDDKKRVHGLIAALLKNEKYRIQS